MGIKCECGKEFEKAESISWIYYPRFDRLLCCRCVKYIHFRLTAEYCLKLVSELNYRSMEMKEIHNSAEIMKKILGYLHLGLLNNKSAIYVLRQSLDTNVPFSEISKNLPDTSKVKKTNEVNRGITNEQAKSLVSNIDLANFFERLALSNFRIEDDYWEYCNERKEKRGELL